MAKYGLLYNLGSGKSKEAKDLISYDNTSGDKIVIEVAADIGATGLATSLKGTLDVAELATLSSGFLFAEEDTAVTSFAIGNADNDKLPTQGYVDDAVAGAVTAGTITYVTFSMLDVTGLAAGKVVAIGADGPVLGAVDNEAKALAVGVIKEVTDGAGTTGDVKVQIDGEATLADAFEGTVVKGGLAFVRAAGKAGDYAGLANDEWISQLGVVTDVAGKKLILQPRVVGQKSA
jgi:hypothetical protein